MSTVKLPCYRLRSTLVVHLLETGTGSKGLIGVHVDGVLRAASRVAEIAGRSMATKIAMMSMTTRSSTKLNALRVLFIGVVFKVALTAWKGGPTLLFATLRQTHS